MKTMGGKTVWHEIRSARMLFTQEEWGDYCERCRQDPSERIVTSFGKYDFNDHDVCLNPDTTTIKVDDKGGYGYYVVFKLANCGNGLWTFGLDYSTGTGGGGYSPSYATPNETREWLKGYPSEKECKLAACDAAIKRLDHAYHPDDPKVLRLKEMVREYKKSLSRPQVVQLSLF